MWVFLREIDRLSIEVGGHMQNKELGFLNQKQVNKHEISGKAEASPGAVVTPQVTPKERAHVCHRRPILPKSEPSGQLWTQGRSGLVLSAAS